MTEEPKRTREFPTDEAILETIKRLRGLETETDPSSESTKWLVSAPDLHPALADIPIGKDGNAATALRFAAILFDQLAGWAVDHVTGRILNDVPAAPPFIHAAPTTEANPDNPPDPKLVAAERAASQPSHEAKGAFYAYDPAPEVERQADRHILAEILTHLAPMFPAELAWGAMDGLYALNMGEVQPLFKPASSLGMTPPAYTRERAKQFALLYFEFHRAWGDKPKAVGIENEIVAAYYPKDKGDASNVRQWRSEDRQHFSAQYGLAGFEWRMMDAKQAGQRVRAWESTPGEGQTDQHERMVVANHKRQFSQDALAYYGKTYQDLPQIEAHNN